MYLNVGFIVVIIIYTEFTIKKMYIIINNIYTCTSKNLYFRLYIIIICRPKMVEHGIEMYYAFLMVSFRMRCI